MKFRPKAADVYPFAAIVAQDEMKLAMILNVVDPRIGGVLIMGHRGTGKSTAVRSLGDLLPEISVVSGCTYRCDPADEQNYCDDCCQAIATGSKLNHEKSAVRVVDLPLGATEDRVCGTIDIEQALRSGVKRFEPGLLARANRGFLYIDEVNLLEDHLVDLLLDVSVTGINNVEREGVSIKHPARFVLVGSGNPEEGELRPQLLDRFGLFVEVKTAHDLDHRMEIVERREAFDRDSESFGAGFANSQEQLRQQISRGRRSFANIKIDGRLLMNIARLCTELKIDGHRGEITISRASRALAAFEGRKKVTEADVRRVAVMALRHRLRRDALEEVASAQRIENAINKAFGSDRVSPAAKDDGDGGDSAHSSSNGEHTDAQRSGSELPSSKRQPAANNGNAKHSQSTKTGGESPAVTPPDVMSATSEVRRQHIDAGDLHSQSVRGSASGSKASRSAVANRTVYSYEQGRYTKAVGSKSSSAKIALDATLRATAAGASRKTNSQIQVPADAIRFKLFKRKQGRLFIFAIDLSGSMAQNRINQVREAMMGLLRQSYIYRDSVAIVGFRGSGAEVMLPPARSIIRARRVLASLPMGGGTPLSAGLACTLDLAKRVGTTAGSKVLLVFTDGGANVPLQAAPRDKVLRQGIIDKEIARLGVELKRAGVSCVLVDTQQAFRVSDTSRIAETLGARLIKL
ncbi:MAG TPA: magnesium chelatase ATPase subunit I [Pyrinomonadaceae bacterium]|nr:magnesium chelatase ATPase subunit I [Pyrinomonadaceae bacterium]